MLVPRLLDIFYTVYLSLFSGGGKGVCVWGGGGNFLYMAEYGCACRMALFFSAARYMIGALFSTKKYTNDPIFLDSYVKGPIFLTSWYMYIFFAQRFFKAACSLGSK